MASSKFNYPAVHRSDFSEQFTSKKDGTVTVADPYQYLHDQDADATVKFVKEQGECAQNYLKSFTDRAKFSEQLKQNWDYARFSTPALKDDGNYYFTFNAGLQAQSPIYRFPKDSKAESGLAPDGKTKLSDLKESGGELFFDPNLLSKDGSVSRSSSAFSPDGKYFAYALSRSGSDWTTIYLRRSDSPHPSTSSAESEDDPGRIKDEVLKFVKFSGIGWTEDSKGFFYQRFPDRSHHSKGDDAAGTETDKDVDAMVYYHTVGTSQAEDVLIWQDPENPEWMFGADGTEDGKYVTLSISRDTGKSNLFYIAPFPSSGKITAREDLTWTTVVGDWGSYYSELGNDGSLFYFLTNCDGAEMYKIVKFDLEKPDLGFVDLIPHDPSRLLNSAYITNTSDLLLLYSQNVTDSLHLHSLSTGALIRPIAENLTKTGSVDSLSVRRKDKAFWFGVSGFGSPGEVFKFTGGEDGEVIKWRETKVEGLKSEDFRTEQVWFESNDGTKVPMFVTRPVGVELDGAAPGILYGYGGFSVSIEPFFSPSLLTWIKHYKGVLAVANIRGGAEFGENWHLAGTKERKQNVFDDFQSAAKYLLANKYVAKDKLAISGGSNGGLLVAACVNQAPELYGAAIADVGVLDMLRFQRFTIGRAWVSDYGNADEDPEAFDYLRAYSPLHNIDASKTYPPTMLLTADHDDRVVPLHSFKHAAELQHTLKDNPNPLLLRVDTKSGHGAGKSTEKKIEEAVDKYGFVSQSMGLTWYD